ncbi:hypothetical protein EVAR_64287_1 [Eumeta japonica]|uniref:Uncharacterized protein n=1 Tax=Eumeta variegata TaxID=151549 RepID=A0A4C2A5D0_EUMVA|nr:hypothetical protein EVAR_64287_1 [Eumeta japonica]
MTALLTVLATDVLNAAGASGVCGEGREGMSHSCRSTKYFGRLSFGGCQLILRNILFAYFSFDRQSPRLHIHLWYATILIFEIINLFRYPTTVAEHTTKELMLYVVSEPNIIDAFLASWL